MTTPIFKAQNLLCSCCGVYFQTWPGYVQADVDRGFGYCKKCQKWQDDMAEQTMDEAIDLVVKALNPQNRERMLGYSRARQEQIVLGLIEKGALSFTIKK